METGPICKGVEQDAVPCLLLLFAPGERPDPARIKNAFRHGGRIVISRDPTAEERRDSSSDDSWLELLVDGLTFDCLGLAPGQGLQHQPVRHGFGIGSNDMLKSLEAIGLTPGPHIEGGGWSLPVLRALCSIAVELIEGLSDCRAVVWRPAQAANAPDFFVEVASDWLSGGVFPLLGLGGIDARTDGTLATRGLAPILGHELVLPAESAGDQRTGTRLLLRIADHLVGTGDPLEGATLIVDDVTYSIALSAGGEDAVINQS